VCTAKRLFGPVLKYGSRHVLKKTNRPALKESKQLRRNLLPRFSFEKFHQNQGYGRWYESVSWNQPVRLSGAQKYKLDKINQLPDL
jgi:hypothetical protein